MKTKRPPKTRLISLRLTEAQYQYLEEASERIREATGCQVTRASIILRIMQKGMPQFEEKLRKELPTIRSQKNSAKKDRTEVLSNVQLVNL